MNTKEKTIPAFLDGGGQMGELIRSFDWSKTSIGSPDTWPQSLRIAVRIMLDCPFGMYIAWGKEYIQLYNDGYRPILGATKHPEALGISTRKTFSEIWPTIEPMFDGVMQGTPVGFPDFILHLDRNGYVEECVFDFSYSPIRLEDGEVGGVLVTVIETTEKVKAVRALKESERRFQNLIREANVGIVVLSGEEMRVDVVNEAYGRLIELKPNDLLGKPLFEVIPHAEEYFRPLLNKVRITGESLYLYDQPYNVVTNGKKVEGYVNVIYQAYKESDGTISGVIALCHDITETIKSRKQIEESQQRFSNIINQVAAGIPQIDITGKFIDVNDRFCEITGRTRKELLKLRIQDITHPDDLLRSMKLFEKGVKDKKTYFIEKRYLKPDGAVAWVSNSFSFVKGEGMASGFMTAVCIDITEQKEAEKKIVATEHRFRFILEQAPDPIVILKGENMVIDIANEPLFNLWGVDKNAIGKPFLEILPEMKEQGFFDMLQDVYFNSKVIKGIETPALFIRPDGTKETIYFNFTYQPYREDDGKISGVLVMASDVTKQVEAKKTN
jgi:PAS domain S-box-containing protein